MFDRLEKVAARFDELTSLLADPAVINRDPYGAGWMVGLKVDPDQLATLLKAADYKKLIGE